MGSYRATELLLAEMAASGGTTGERAHGLLGILRLLVPFDGAWLAVVDPAGHGYHSVASLDLEGPIVDYLSEALMERDIEVADTDRARLRLTPSDLPHPTDVLRTWADGRLSGISEAWALGLSTPSGRHVGFLGLLSGDRHPTSSSSHRRLAGLGPVLAHGIDPMRSFLPAARLVHRAAAGVVLCHDGGCQPLPGLPEDPLLTPHSAALAAARECIDDGHVYSSFLWPARGIHAPSGHVRVTAMAAPEDAPPALTGLVLLAPGTGLRGLTPRELEVLGLLIEGCSNQEISHALVVAPRTVAAHLEHILDKLEAPTRTLAAVRAERDGLYVPSPPAGAGHA